MKVLQPPNWPRPRGYSNGIAARGTLIFVSGQIGWDETGKLAGQDFLSQSPQALLNVVAVLKEAKAAPAHIVRMNWYVVDREEYLAAQKELGALSREISGAHYPSMTAVQVAALIEPGARLEIEVTAVVPE